MPKVVIEHLTFATKAAAKAHFSQMLSSGELVEHDLLALLRQHPEATLKIGEGVKRFYVAGNEWGGRCFWIERVDGTTTDFSYLSCLTPPKPEHQAKLAFRYAIQNQVISFRDSAFHQASTVPCALTGVPVTSDESHVDHAPPYTFDALLAMYCKDRELDLATVEVNPTEDGDTTTRLADAQLASDWAQFHETHAKLRITHKTANLKQKRKS